MECLACEGKGMLTPQEHAAVLAFIETQREMWCRCGNVSPEEQFADFYGDGEHRGCMHKHHYHCGRCGKVSQIG